MTEKKKKISRVKHITLEIGDDILVLTVEEARQLYDLLHELFNRHAFVTYAYPQTTWTGTGTGATNVSMSNTQRQDDEQ